MSSWIRFSSGTPVEVKISTSASQHPRRNLLLLLEQHLPVRFIVQQPPEVEAVDKLAFRAVGGGEVNTPASGLSSLCIVRPPNGVPYYPDRTLTVSFSNDDEVPNPFRGRTVTTRVGWEKACLSLSPCERILASSVHGPIWTIREAGGIKHFRSALPLPHLSASESFSDIFGGEQFLEMLPLMHFLTEVSVGAAYHLPPLRAAFIIDDPNLHWPRYGFVDYRELAAHARKEDYHVAFATIPMDTWFTHAGAADLFRKHAEQLSLLIHGNNHGKDELARPYSAARRNGLLRQAIKRIERLEAKAGLQVCRVMVPPHGACSSAMLADLPWSGFESACISTGSLRAHNWDQQWIKTLGYAPSENVEGCTVLPRWGFSGSVENTLLVAAYLGRPMILRGHHNDLKDGVDVLERYSRFINGLGDVRWSNLTTLSRLNWLWRKEGTSCRLRPLAPKVLVDVPSWAKDLTIDTPCSTDSEVWQVCMPDGSVRSVTGGRSLPVGDVAGQTLRIERARRVKSGQAVERLPPSPKLALRRLLTEARDRILGAW